jgi:hypothetical protein
MSYEFVRRTSPGIGFRAAGVEWRLGRLGLLLQWQVISPLGTGLAIFDSLRPAS